MTDRGFSRALTRTCVDVNASVVGGVHLAAFDGGEGSTPVLWIRIAYGHVAHDAHSASCGYIQWRDMRHPFIVTSEG